MDIHGVLVIDKPSGFTSFDVIAKLRGILGTRKIGHSGTLDPMATGVLPIFVGSATKAADMQLNTGKTYLATVQFGVKTDTGDITGEVLEHSEKLIDEDMLKAILPRFVGAQPQVPPMYSAVKINGTPLYKLAREGKEIERTPREITIYDIEYKGEIGKNSFLLQITCSKGTYVRTLLEDIGKALECPATMASLKRIQSGIFELSQVVTLEELQEAKEKNLINKMLMPVSCVFQDYPKLQVSAQDIIALKNGVKLKEERENGIYAIWKEDVFFGVVNIQDNTMRVKKLFLQEDEITD